MGWTGGKDGKSWKVGGVDEKSKEDKKEFKRLEYSLSKRLRPGDGQIGVYFEHPDPKVDNSLNLTPYDKKPGAGPGPSDFPPEIVYPSSPAT